VSGSLKSGARVPKGIIFEAVAAMVILEVGWKDWDYKSALQLAFKGISALLWAMADIQHRL
jgi:hypothetical protein